MMEGGRREWWRSALSTDLEGYRLAPSLAPDEGPVSALTGFNLRVLYVSLWTDFSAMLHSCGAIFNIGTAISPRAVLHSAYR